MSRALGSKSAAELPTGMPCPNGPLFNDPRPFDLLELGPCKNALHQGLDCRQVYVTEASTILLSPIQTVSTRQATNQERRHPLGSLQRIINISLLSVVCSSESSSESETSATPAVFRRHLSFRMATLLRGPSCHDASMLHQIEREKWKLTTFQLVALKMFRRATIPWDLCLSS